MSEYKLKNWRILFSLIVFISICFNLGFNHNQIVNAESELNSLTVIKYLNNQEERPVNQVPSEPSTVQVDALFKAWKVSDGPMGMNEIENQLPLLSDYSHGELNARYESYSPNETGEKMYLLNYRMELISSVK